MKTKFLLLFVAVLVFFVCIPATAQKLYPVQGPLSAQSPVPVFSGQVKHPIISVGSIFRLVKSWKLSDGEVVDGTVKVVKATSVDAAVPGAPADNPPQANLASAWDAVYGQGYFVAHLLGNEFMQGLFTGNQGTVLQVESLDGQRGVAVDNKGNVYKMVW